MYAGGGSASVGFMPGGQQQQPQPPQQGNSLASTVALTFLDPAEPSGYEGLFRQAGPTPNGQLSAQQARNVLLQSGLPNEVLARVWSLCATTLPTALYFPEFCLAMHLCKLARAGNMPPSQLPDVVRQQLQQSLVNLSQLGMIAQGGSVSAHSTGNSSSAVSMPNSMQMNNRNVGMNPGGFNGVTMQNTGGSAGHTSPMSLTPAQTGNATVANMNANMGLPMNLNINMPAMATGAPGAQQAQQSQGQERKWAITPAEKGQYDAIFKVWDAERTGYITGDRARNIFQQSGLPGSILAHIWALADMQRRGKLNQDEFAIAMHLVYQKLNGRDLPQTLPPDLVPPAQRDLDSLTSLAKTQIMSQLANKKQNQSPFGSQSNLAGVAGNDPLASFSPFGSRTNSTTNSPNLSRRGTQVDPKQKQLAELVMSRKNELKELKESAETSNRSCTEYVKECKRIEEEVRVTHSEVKRTSSSATGVGSVDVSQAELVEREIQRLLAECRELNGRISEKRRGKLSGSANANSGSGTGPVSADPVQARAAALLAARMAALGISAPTSTPPPAATSTPALAADPAQMARISAEEERNRRELQQAEERVRMIMSQIRAANSANSQTASKEWASAEERLKWEQGVGIQSREVRKVLEDLRQNEHRSFASNSPRATSTSTFSPAPTPAPSISKPPSFDYPSRATSDISSPSTAQKPLSANPFQSMHVSATPPPPPPPPPSPPSTSTPSTAASYSSPARTSTYQAASAANPFAATSTAVAGTTAYPDSSQALPATATREGSKDSVNDVVAQAEAAIRAVKERMANKLSAPSTPTASSPGATQVGTPTNPFGPARTGTTDTFFTAPTSPLTTKPTSPTKALDSTPFSPPAALTEMEDPVEAVMKRLKEQEQSLGLADFSKGVATEVPSPTPKEPSRQIHSSGSDVKSGTTIGSSSPRVTKRDEESEKPTSFSDVFEKIRAREEEVLRERDILKQMEEQRRRFVGVGPKKQRSLSLTTSDSSLGSGSEDEESAVMERRGPSFVGRLQSVKEMGSFKNLTGARDVESPIDAVPRAVPASPPAPIVAAGGPPPPPPPPPPPGEVRPVKPYERGSGTSTPATDDFSRRSSTKKPAPQDVGASSLGPASFAAELAKAVGKVGGKFMGLAPGASQKESLSDESDKSPVKSEDDWEVVSQEAQSPAHEAIDAGGPTLNRRDTTMSMADIFSDRYADNNAVPTIVLPMSEEPEAPLYQVQALYAYEATAAQDLALNVDDIVEVIREEGDWLYGRSIRGEGWFPATYTERCSDTSKDVDITRAPTPSLLSSRPLLRAEAIWEYVPVNPDELSLVKGEVVDVLDTSAGDWWNVENAQGETGLVPANYLKDIGDGASVATADVGSDVVPSDLKAFDDSSMPTDRTQPINLAALKGGDHSTVPEIVEPLPAYPGAAVASQTSSSSSLNSQPPALPPKAKGGAIPKSHSFDVQSLSTYGQEGVSPHFPQRQSSLEEAKGDGFLNVTSGGLPKSTSFAVQPTQASTAWAAKLDPYRLSLIPPDERKRQEAIYELIATEQTYVRDLELIREVFYEPMISMVSQADLDDIFCNLEDIKIVNAIILSDLESIQMKNDYVIDEIGDVFCNHAPSLDVYQTYCGNFGFAQKLLQKRRTEKPRLADYLKRQQSTNPACRSLDLSSFLLQPMQRITRYSLLLKQILHHTPKTHRDHDSVVRALALAEKAAEQVNAAARERESREKLEEVEREVDLTWPPEDYKLDLFSPTRCLGARTFLFEGELVKLKSGRKLKAYLFNDVLLLCKANRDKSKYQYVLYRRPMPLNDIAVRDLPKLHHSSVGSSSSIDESCFQIVDGANQVNLRATSAGAKRKWVNMLDEQTRQYFLAEKALSEGNWKGGKFVYGHPIGTLQVLVLEARGLVRVARAVSKLDLFCRVQLNRQQVKTRTVNSQSPRWNQTMFLSVLSLDETLKISIYNYDRYSQDDYLGQAEIPLDFLEYYDERETEPITLSLRDVPSGQVVVRLAYRKA
ncbi:hypothetical protein BC832DRAFT_589560 [Gaertneriomyces semiglobifer]|nr:hypothetical protein BC832DRAFT_589560 [Gaertneriomyces semiglobifer]